MKKLKKCFVITLVFALLMSSIAVPKTKAFEWGGEGGTVTVEAMQIIEFGKLNSVTFNFTNINKSTSASPGYIFEPNSNQLVFNFTSDMNAPVLLDLKKMVLVDEKRTYETIAMYYVNVSATTNTLVCPGLSENEIYYFEIENRGKVTINNLTVEIKNK